MIKKHLLKILSPSIWIGGIILGCSLCILSGCEESSDQLPAFIQVDTAMISANSDQGTESHNIISIFLFVDNQPLGVYEPPTSIPILAEGSTKISLLAGVATNGIFNLQTPYPLYNAAEFTVDLAPLETTTINPVYVYDPTTIFVYNNDFEFSNNFTISTSNPVINLVRGPAENVFEGTRSAMVELDELNTSFNMHNTDFYDLPSSLRPVYLEMNYKCTAPFEVFVESIAANGGNADALFVAGVNTKESWNKIYIDLRQAVTELNNANLTKHRISFRAILPENQTEASFFWDNIKLLHEPQ